MYDMYNWDEAADAARRHVAASPWPAALTRGENPPEPPATSGRGRRFSTGPAGRARAKQAPGVRAVQVALDRRDNGGDSSAARDQ